MAAVFSLPILSLAEVGTPGADKRLAEQFRAAALATGFLQIVDHSVPKQLIDDLFAMSETFFRLPLAEKTALARDPFTNRGYEILGGQRLEGSLGNTPVEDGLVNAEQVHISDQKEGIMIGHNEVREGDPLFGRFGHAVNQLPSEERMPGLRDLVASYCEKMLALSRTMMDLVALSLDLDPATAFTREVVTDPMAFLRFLHYPPTPDRGQTGIGSHSDFGWITLLATSGTPGLELFSGGEWITLEPEPGAFILNIGDMLSTMTGGAYKSSLHRVINRSAKSRFSIPFFLEGRNDFVVRPLGTDPASKEVFPTVEEVLRGRFDSTYTGYK